MGKKKMDIAETTDYDYNNDKLHDETSPVRTKVFNSFLRITLHLVYSLQQWTETF